MHELSPRLLFICFFPLARLQLRIRLPFDFFHPPSTSFFASLLLGATALFILERPLIHVPDHPTSSGCTAIAIPGVVEIKNVGLDSLAQAQALDVLQGYDN